MLESVKSGNELTNLLPTHTKSWWPLVEDVFMSPAVADMSSALLEQAISHDDCQSLSIDGTFRICFSLLGQARFDAPKSVRDTFPFHGDAAVTRVISIRGRTGSVLGLLPAADESSGVCYLQQMKALGNWCDASRSLYLHALGTKFNILPQTIRLPSCTRTSLLRSHTLEVYRWTRRMLPCGMRKGPVEGKQQGLCC